MEDATRNFSIEYNTQMKDILRRIAHLELAVAEELIAQQDQNLSKSQSRGRDRQSRQQKCRYRTVRSKSFHSSYHCCQERSHYFSNSYHHEFSSSHRNFSPRRNCRSLRAPYQSIQNLIIQSSKHTKS